jgi:hypothetical protein
MVVFEIYPGFFTEGVTAGWGANLVARFNGQSIYGDLYFSTPPWLPPYYSYGPGGYFDIWGSMPGADPGSTLLSGTFSWGRCSDLEGVYVYYQGCDLGIQVDYVNPALLGLIGLPPGLVLPGSLSGATYGEWTESGWTEGFSWVDVSVSLPIPEPSTLVLTGWGLMVFGLAYLRRRRN